MTTSFWLLSTRGHWERRHHTLIYNVIKDTKILQQHIINTIELPKNVTFGYTLFACATPTCLLSLIPALPITLILLLFPWQRPSCSSSFLRRTCFYLRSTFGFKGFNAHLLHQDTMAATMLGATIPICWVFNTEQMTISRYGLSGLSVE